MLAVALRSSAPRLARHPHVRPSVAGSLLLRAQSVLTCGQLCTLDWLTSVLLSCLLLFSISRYTPTPTAVPCRIVPFSVCLLQCCASIRPAAVALLLLPYSTQPLRPPRLSFSSDRPPSAVNCTLLSRRYRRRQSVRIGALPLCSGTLSLSRHSHLHFLSSAPTCVSVSELNSQIPHLCDSFLFWFSPIAVFAR